MSLFVLFLYIRHSTALKHVQHNPSLQIQMYHHISPMTNSVTVGIIFVSTSAIKIPARTGPNWEPMATPSFYWYISRPKQKWIFLVHSNNKLRMLFLLIEVSISFRWYILSKATIVSSRGTLVNRDFTSNDIILNPWETFTLRILCVKSLVLLTVYWGWLKGNESFAKYFASC